MAEQEDVPTVIFTSGNYMEAEFVASVLTGSGISAFVVDDNVCRMLPQVASLIGGAKVLVKASDVSEAREVLASFEGTSPLITGSFVSIPLSEPAAVITFIRNWFRKHRSPIA